MTIESLQSQRVERHVLGGLIKNPQLVTELQGFVTLDDFTSNVHQVIYSTLEKQVLGRSKIDKVILAQKITELGISFKDDINIFDYIDSLSLTQITNEGIKDAARELIRLRVKRNIVAVGDMIKSIAIESGDATIDEMVSKADTLYHDKMHFVVQSNEPSNIFESMPYLIEERGNSPIEEIGFPTAYSEFNRLFGGLRGGNIYAIVSRPGSGKTTWIDDLCFGVSRLSRFKIPALILDTEMFTQDITFRMAAAITGVPMWYLETGQWRKNPEMFEKVRKTMAEIRNNKYIFQHLHVANRTGEEVASIMKRWYYTKVGRGNPALIAYDYIKLTGEKINGNWAEHQAVGQKIDMFKRVAEELNVPFISAMQLNRQGESQNRASRDLTDDSSAISLTDRLQWWASWVAILRRKTHDELEQDGIEFGTHKLINTKKRFEGREATGHMDFMIRPTADGKKRFVQNFINYQIDNFKVEEKGSLKDIIAKEKLQFDFENSKNKGESCKLE